MLRLSLFFKFQWFFLLFSFYSCINVTSQNKSINDSLFFNLSENLLTIEEGINQISILEVQSENLISFRDDGYELIKFQDSKIYAGNRNEDELHIIDTFGVIKKTIFSNRRDITGPRIIRDFTITPNNLIVFEKSKNLFYIYTQTGDFITTKQSLDTTFNINSIAFLPPNHLILQKYHNNLKTSLKRDKSLVGKVLDLSTYNTIRSIYYPGGSETRDKTINLRFHEVDNGVLYNYRNSKEFYFITQSNDEKVLSFESKDLLTKEYLNMIDHTPPNKASEMLNTEYRKNNKIDAFHFYYMHNNIYFFTTFWKGNLYWVFYNAVKDHYKTMKFQPMTVYSHKGIPFRPYVKNAKDNFFMVFLDGQAMQNTEKIKFDKNKAYFIKIYPKYLNQEAWE